MLPWIPTSPPGCCFSFATSSSTGAVTRVVFAHSSDGVVEVATCFWVLLMKEHDLAHPYLLLYWRSLNESILLTGAESFATPRRASACLVR